MERHWYEIALDVPREHMDEAAALLATHGFAGCEMRERAGSAQVVVFTQAASAEDAHATALSAAGVLSSAPMLQDRTIAPAQATPLDPHVWTENWRRHFSRHTIGGRIEILPPWEEASAGPEGLLSIVINPGMAFGTGLHETTSGCLEALIRLVRPGQSILDLGCGSAILAIAAARLGAARALAVDNDPVAVEAAQENIERNAVEQIVRTDLARDAGATGTNVASCWQEEVFDIVVANILAETLVEMQERLTGAVADGGELILSGIEMGRLKLVLDTFDRPGWTLTDVLERGEWATVLLHRNALAPRT